MKLAPLSVVPLVLALGSAAAEPNKSPSLRELQQIAERSVRYVDRQLEANRRRAGEIEAAQAKERMVDHAEAGADAMKAAAENLGNAASPNPLSKAKAGIGGGEALDAIKEQTEIEQAFVDSVTDGKDELQRLSDERRELTNLRNKLTTVKSGIVQARRNIAAKQKAAREQAAKDKAAAEAAQQAHAAKSASPSRSTERRSEPDGRGADRMEAGRGYGPRNDGPRNEGPRNEGPRNEGPRNEGPRNEGPRNEGPRNEGTDGPDLGRLG